MADPTDEDWMRALGGKPPPEGDRSSVREAAAVREAMLKAQLASSAAPPDDAGLEHLLFRLRREGLIGGSGFSRWQYATVAIAATVALSVGVVTMYRGVAPEPV